MGLFNKLMGRSDEIPKVDRAFVEVVRALDNGEEWARKEINRMNESNDPYLTDKLCRARIEIYSDAAYAGNPEAQYWLGYSLQNYNPKESFRLLKGLADGGSIRAMKAIAMCYTQYGGYGENNEQYKYWYMKAAEAGDADAQYTVGLEYMADGNLDEAEYWYKLSASQNYSKGLLNYAKLLDQKRMRIMPENKQNDNEIFYVEDLLLEALNKAKYRDEFVDAASEISHFYYRCCIGNVGPLTSENTIKRAAYFAWVAYLDGGNVYMKEHFNRIINEYNIYVNTSDIEQWAKDEKLFG
ncbi:tetratricopeptide repeat protein [Blautia sp.]